MPAHNPTVPVRYTAVLFECIESLGADSGAVLAAADLPADLFEHPDTSVTLTELGALLEEVQRVTGREGLGFEVGRRIEVEAHGALGQTLQRCTTIDHALRVGSRFASLVTPSFVIEYRGRRTARRGGLSAGRGDDPELMRFMFECHACGFHNLLTALMDGTCAPMGCTSPPKPQHMPIATISWPRRACILRRHRCRNCGLSSIPRTWIRRSRRPRRNS